MSAVAAPSYAVKFTVGQSPTEAYAAINNVRGWWSENIEGATDKLGEFVFHNEPIHMSRMRITELVPGKRVVWCVVDNFMSFVADKTEWIGNVIVFDIAQGDGETEVNFTQHGLVPDYQCFDLCSNAWGGFITRKRPTFPGVLGAAVSGQPRVPARAVQVSAAVVQQGACCRRRGEDQRWHREGLDIPHDVTAVVVVVRPGCESEH